MAEIWEDLQCAGLMICRDTEGFTYGHDAVLLADFIRARRGERLLDFCAGTGIIGLLAHAKTGVDVWAVDLSEQCCALMEKSVARNGLTEAVHVLHKDLRLIPDDNLPWESFDCAACNPPYFSGGTESPNPARRHSIHEIDCSLPEVAACARRMLKNGGRFFVCYPASGLSRLCAALEGEKLAVKRLCFVRAKLNKPPYLVLAEAKKGGGSGLVLENDLILEDR